MRDVRLLVIDFCLVAIAELGDCKKKGDSNKNKRRKKIAFAGMAVGESPLLGQVFLVLALIQIE